MKTDSVELIPIHGPRIHPLAERLPLLSPRHPRFVELRDSIAEHGVQNPIILDGQNCVVVGRHRLLAAKLAGKRSIPSVRRSLGDAEIAALILPENLVRQDMSQGKRALMLVSCHEACFKERKARQTRGLRRGASPVAKHFTTAERATSIETLTVRHGVNRLYLSGPPLCGINATGGAGGSCGKSGTMKSAWRGIRPVAREAEKTGQEPLGAVARRGIPPSG